jgi:hypothetical protein
MFCLLTSTKKLVFFKLSVRRVIAFAKLVYPQQLLYLAKRDYIVNEDSQALLDLGARSRLSGQLEIKHSLLPHLVLTLKLQNSSFFKVSARQFSRAHLLLLSLTQQRMKLALQQSWFQKSTVSFLMSN